MYKNADGQYVINIDVYGAECDKLVFPEEEYIDFENAYNQLQDAKNFQNSYQICLYISGKSIGFCLFNFYTRIEECPDLGFFQTIVDLVFLKPDYRGFRFSRLMANEIVKIICNYSLNSRCTKYEDVSQIKTSQGEIFVNNIKRELKYRGIHHIS